MLALVAGLALAGVAFLLREPAASGVQSLARWVEGLGVWGPPAFVATFAVAVPLCLPAAPFLLAAGILFGVLGGILFATLGVLLGGAVTFLLGRRVVRARVERKLASQTGWAVMSRALRQEGLRGISLIRLSPVLPAWLIHYALGVSRVSWRDYWLSSFTVLPTVLLYVFSGAGLGDLAALQRGGSAKQGLFYYAVLGAGILATLAASILLGRRARRILDEMED